MGVYEQGFSDPSSAKPSASLSSDSQNSRWASPQAQLLLTAASIAATAVIFNHLTAYAVNPFEDSYSFVRKLELMVFWVGWLAVCFGPAAISVGSRLGWQIPDWSVFAIGVGWPAIIVLLQVTLYLEFGAWFISYLQTNPALLISDVLAPAALVVAHLRLGARPSQSGL